MLDPTEQDQLRSAVRATAERAEVARGLTDLYARVAQEISRRRPVCVVSGRCCRFEEFGHRLFVTTIELANFMHSLDSSPRNELLNQSIADWNGTGCPFQTGKLCGVHAIRPFGCQMFFCDASAGEWQNQTYEMFHAELKRLHEALDVPYFYVEWREALRTMNVTNSHH